MLDAVVAARAPILPAIRPVTHTAARVVDLGATRTSARVADRDATCITARVADRHDISADDRPDARAICCTDVPADVLDGYSANARADFFVDAAAVRFFVRADIPAAECADFSATVCAVSPIAVRAVSRAATVRDNPSVAVDAAPAVTATFRCPDRISALSVAHADSSDAAPFAVCANFSTASDFVCLVVNAVSAATVRANTHAVECSDV